MSVIEPRILSHRLPSRDQPSAGNRSTDPPSACAPFPDPPTAPILSFTPPSPGTLSIDPPTEGILPTGPSPADAPSPPLLPATPPGPPARPDGSLTLLTRSRMLLGRSARLLLNRLDSPALVLLYHRVTRLPNDPQQLSVSPENFYAQVSFLKKKCSLLEINEFDHLLRKKRKMPRKAVILTFDDGYADNCLEALPILEALGAQALFFITTSLLNTPYECWWDELERIFLEDLPLPARFEKGKIPGLPAALGDLDVHSRNRKLAYELLHPVLKYMPPASRDEMIGNLQQWAGLPAQGRTTHRMMTSAELITLAGSPSAVIGAHTHNHPALSVLPYAQQLEEIKQSLQFLRKTLSKEIPYFSYPYGGKKDFNKASIQACREAGFTLSFANHYGQVRRRTDPFRIPRVLVRDWEEEIFAEKIAKSFTY